MQRGRKPGALCLPAPAPALQGKAGGGEAGTASTGGTGGASGKMKEKVTGDKAGGNAVIESRGRCVVKRGGSAGEVWPRLGGPCKEQRKKGETGSGRARGAPPAGSGLRGRAGPRPRLFGVGFAIPFALVPPIPPLRSRHKGGVQPHFPRRHLFKKYLKIFKKSPGLRKKAETKRRGSFTEPGAGGPPGGLRGGSPK